MTAARAQERQRLRPEAEALSRESCDIAAFKVMVLVEETHLLWATDAEQAKRDVLTSRGQRVTIARHPVEVTKVEEVNERPQSRANRKENEGETQSDSR